MRFPTRVMLAGAAALVVAVAGVSLVLAQTPTPTPAAGQTGPRPRADRQAFLEVLARRLGVTVERLQQAISETRTELGLPARDGRPESGRFGRPGHGGPGGLFGAGLSAAAEAIGITPEQLRQELPGKSLAQVAQAHGKNAADVAAALTRIASAKIDQAVANGRLPADRAEQVKQRLSQQIDRLMNRVVPERSAQRRQPNASWSAPGQSGVSHPSV